MLAAILELARFALAIALAFVLGGGMFYVLAPINLFFATICCIAASVFVVVIYVETLNERILQRDLRDLIEI